MISTENLSALTTAGGHVVGSDGSKIGSVGQIYVDDQTSEPTWVTVKTGLFGTHESFAPLDSATQDGDDIVIAHTKDKVKDAPRVAPDGHLEPEEEDELYAYYGLRGSNGHTGNGFAGTGRETTVDADARGTVGHDTSGPTTDDAMTRSEEKLHVGTEREATGRARLRKYVVTENVEETVPVQREEVRVEREPITEGNVDQALDGPGISEEEHEVVLHAEEPVVEKRAVPKERVRLEKDTVTDERTVSDEVRKERIVAEGDVDDTTRG
jgi:uncharacterized protein (TIGR02271 family)